MRRRSGNGQSNMLFSNYTLETAYSARFFPYAALPVDVGHSRLVINVRTSIVLVYASMVKIVLRASVECLGC